MDSSQYYQYLGFFLARSPDFLRHLGSSNKLKPLELFSENTSYSKNLKDLQKRFND